MPKNYQNISSGLKVILPLHFLKILPRRDYLKEISHWTHLSNLVNIYLYAKYYQNIPSDLKVIRSYH